jgi:RND family efflux transporter MFP subunit
MKTRTLFVWTLVAAAVLALGARAWIARKPATVPPAAPAAAAQPAALELADGDLLLAAVVDLERTVDVSGSIRAANTAFVKARVAGELKSLSVREGDAVKAGQVIGQIDTTEYDWRLRQAEQQARQARAQLEIAQRTLRNNRALVDQGFISPTALETSVSNEAAAQANAEAADAAVALARKARGDATLAAPIAGFVAQRLAQPGERVAVEARIVEVVDLSRLEVEASVPPRDAAQLRVGQKATLEVEGVADVVHASVARISPAAQAGSRAVPVYLALERAGATPSSVPSAPSTTSPSPSSPARTATSTQLRTGLFARGTVAVDQRRVLAVPVALVRNDQPQPSVARVVDGVVALDAVGLGAYGRVAAEPVVEITSGVREGDLLLAASAGAVRAGTRVKVPAATAAVGAAPNGPASAATASSTPAKSPAPSPSSKPAAVTGATPAAAAR